MNVGAVGGLFFQPPARPNEVVYCHGPIRAPHIPLFFIVRSSQQAMWLWPMARMSGMISPPSPVSGHWPTRSSSQRKQACVGLRLE